MSTGLHSTRRIVPVARPYRTPTGPDYAAIQESPEFRKLRRVVRFAEFTGAFLVMLNVMGYALLGAYAEEFMTRKVIGNINVALLGSGVLLVLALGLVAGYMIALRYWVVPRINQIRYRAGCDAE